MIPPPYICVKTDCFHLISHEDLSRSSLFQISSGQEEAEDVLLLLQQQQQQLRFQHQTNSFKHLSIAKVEGSRVALLFYYL